MTERTWLSKGDFIDLYHKIRLKGYFNLLSHFSFSGQARVRAKWNHVEGESDFWSIAEVRQRWNEKCTGHPDLGYEAYLCAKYFDNLSGLSLLSVGCGSGSREQRFAGHKAFSRVVGIDVAENQVNEARKKARDLNNVSYLTGDFRTALFDKGSFDVILFNSSLHHFKAIDQLLEKRVKPLLKEGGFLVIFEYVGPDRLQWTSEQLRFANKLLASIPSDYRRRWGTRIVKKRIYRPGWLRMHLIDPSEAVDSASILPAIHKHFKIIEERKAGSDILHILLKDIAHHFTSDDSESQRILQRLFDEEDRYMAETGRSDYIFGLYQNQPV
ncbi:MAG: hypothetical protein CVU06_05010 [Bacteroidetes bacterium HGW-Bacteroidetes-22]|nr:MAG: hypothetical protein CVU06_05010 [Bacteroidetes bacterium HGW-Bacteroidetes-22]